MRLSKRIANRNPVVKKANDVRESKIENTVTDFAKKNGWIVRKLAWIGRRNAPDRFFAKGGVIILVEFKKPGGDATEKQSKEHETLRAAGVHVVVINSIEVGREIFR